MAITHSLEGVVPATTSGILGEVVTWSCGKARVSPKYTTTLAKIRAALDAAGFDPNLAKILNVKNAFTRVVQVLKKDGVVTQKDKSDTHIWFQVNDIQTVGAQDQAKTDYPYRATLVLNIKTGDVICPDGSATGAAQAAEAQRLLNQLAEEREAKDVTRLIQRVVTSPTRGRKNDPSKPHVDLIRIRDHGGVYFVFGDQLCHIDRLAVFCDLIGARLERLPIANLPAGGKSIGRALADHLDDEIDRYDDALDNLKDSAREKTFKDHAQNVQDIRFLLECRQSFLSTEADRLNERLAKLDAKRAVIQDKILGKDEDWDAETDAPAAPLTVDEDPVSDEPLPLPEDLYDLETGEPVTVPVKVVNAPVIDEMPEDVPF